MDRKTILFAAGLAAVSIVLVGIVLMPLDRVPAWALGTWGGLPVYVMAGLWVFLLVGLFDRLMGRKR